MSSPDVLSPDAASDAPSLDTAAGVRPPDQPIETSASQAAASDAQPSPASVSDTPPSPAPTSDASSDVTFSPRRRPRAIPIEPLPPALSSMWRLCMFGYRHEPLLMVWAFGLALTAAVPDALIALWLKLLGNSALDGDVVLVLVSAMALAVSGAGTWLLSVVSSRVQRRFRDKVTIAL